MSADAAEKTAGAAGRDSWSGGADRLSGFHAPGAFDRRRARGMKFGTGLMNVSLVFQLSCDVKADDAKRDIL